MTMESGRLVAESEAPTMTAALAWFDQIRAMLVAYSLPPGEILHSTCQPICAGQFITVVSGSLQMDGQVLKKWETVFLTPDETSTIMQAGVGGAQVISMHVPPMDPAFQ